MKNIFIVNPTSGSGIGRKAISLIEKIAKEKNLDYEILETKYSGHAKEIAANYSIKDNVCLYAVGGDGTAYEILNGLSDHVVLSIIPCGTGNDFYRVISETPPASLEQRIREAIEGRIVEIDYGLSNHTRFLNTTTLGFDAEINDRVNKLMKKSKLPPKMMYLSSAISKLVNPPCLHLHIDIDGTIIEKDFLLCAIMNGKYYGGGFNPTPDANIQDGWFDICLVEPLNRSRIIALIGKYMKGQHTSLKECTMLQGRHITITSEKEVIMQSDGESFYDNRITLDIMKSSLRLQVPQHSPLK